jgi:hypothetical protein
MNDPDTLYGAVALALPFVLVGVSRPAPHRWGCTILAAIYTLFQMSLLWILTLGHMVPAEFPLLLIAWALTLDLARPTENLHVGVSTPHSAGSDGCVNFDAWTSC